MVKLRKIRRLFLRAFIPFAVVAMVGVLLVGTLEWPSYYRATQAAKQAVLSEDLRVIHMAVKAFTEDNQRQPRSLDELVQTGYLKMVPTNPTDNRRFKSW